MFTHGKAIYILLLIDSLFLSHEATTIKSIPLSSRQTNDTVYGPTLNWGMLYILKSAYPLTNIFIHPKKKIIIFIIYFLISFHSFYFFIPHYFLS